MINLESQEWKCNKKKKRKMKLSVNYYITSCWWLQGETNINDKSGMIQNEGTLLEIHKTCIKDFLQKLKLLHKAFLTKVDFDILLIVVILNLFFFFYLTHPIMISHYLKALRKWMIKISKRHQPRTDML